MSDNKRFEFTNVDCNQCQCYWDDSCSGVPVGHLKAHCTAFKATRHTDIPLQIKRLKTSIKWLTAAYAALFALVLIKIWG